MIRTVFMFRHEYSVAQVDVFGGRAFLWSEVITWILHRLGKPIVLTLHGGSLPGFADRYPRRISRVFVRAKVITAPSQYLKTDMQSRGFQVSLIPNAIAVDRYPYRVRCSPLPNFLWLRSFHHNYNPSLAPQIIAKLKQKFPTTTLTMCGPDKGDGSFQQVKEVAQTEDVLNNIQFPGKLTKEQIPKFGNMSDIFLNTTNVDNTPISVMEAMAMGMCIVSTNVGGIPFLLEDEKDALLVPPDDLESMVAACSRILHEPELAKRLSKNARHKVECFDWTQVLPKWEKVISMALS